MISDHYDHIIPCHVFSFLFASSIDLRSTPFAFLMNPGDRDPDRVPESLPIFIHTRVFAVGL
jgi:hypothetical protein